MNTRIGPVERIDITDELIRRMIPGLRDDLSDDEKKALKQVLKSNIGMRDGALVIREILPAHIAAILNSSWKDVFKSREQDKK